MTSFHDNCLFSIQHANSGKYLMESSEVYYTNENNNFNCTTTTKIPYTLALFGNTPTWYKVDIIQVYGYDTNGMYITSHITNRTLGIMYPIVNDTTVYNIATHTILQPNLTHVGIFTPITDGPIANNCYISNQFEIGYEVLSTYQATANAKGGKATFTFDGLANMSKNSNDQLTGNLYFKITPVDGHYIGDIFTFTENCQLSSSFSSFTESSLGIALSGALLLMGMLEIL